MQNPARLLSRSRWVALAEGADIVTGLPHELVEALLHRHFGHTGVLTPLHRTTIEKVVPGARHGWCLPLPIDYLGQSREIQLILPQRFPADPIRAFIHPPAFLHWPHAESDGRLCLWTDALSPVAHTPETQVERCLERIQDILGLVGDDAHPEKREAEFAREWLSYWTQGTAGSYRAASQALLVTPPPTGTTTLATCMVRSRDKQQAKLLIGSDPLALRAWREALGEPKAGIADANALFVCLTRAPIGAPRNLEQVRELLSEFQQALEALEHYLQRPEPVPFWVVLAVRDANPQVVAALELAPNPPAGVRTPHQRDQKRRGREWKRIAAHAWRVRIQSIERADSAWIHGRGFDEDAIALRGKRVTLIGCGSLGGLVAQALAHTGIGHLTLIDPETLEVANLGRHVLDATALGLAKASALASRIRMQLPHLDVRAISHRVQDPAVAAVLENADLVICTAADWPAERFLIDAMEGHGIPLLLSWAEPHALAGHSAADTTGGRRLEHLFDRDGLAVRRRTDWPETAWALPGCSASHQPGTFNRLQHVAGLVAEHAIDVLLEVAPLDGHRIWLGDSLTLSRLGGNWIDPPPSDTSESVIKLPLPHAS